MRRLMLVILAAMALVGNGVGVGQAATPTVSGAAVGKLGTVLVDGAGRTLYRLTQETAGKIACTGGCAKVWPPVLKGTSLTLAKGLTGKLGTIPRPDKKLQVTYNGIPLYRYAGDTKRGTANGQGIGKVWFVVKPGERVKAPTATTTTTTTTAPKPATPTTVPVAPSSGTTTSTPAPGGDPYYPGY